jgi:hypothetical protein
MIEGARERCRNVSYGKVKEIFVDAKVHHLMTLDRVNVVLDAFIAFWTHRDINDGGHAHAEALFFIMRPPEKRSCESGVLEGMEMTHLGETSHNVWPRCPVDGVPVEQWRLDVRDNVCNEHVLSC